MTSARSRLLATAVGLLGVLAFASTASAATLTQTPFGCRASTARVTLLNNITVEPYVANPGQTPCVDSSDAVQKATVPESGEGNIQAAEAGVFTDSVFDSTGATAPGATAVATVDGVTIPTADGTIYVAGPIQAVASYACVNDNLVTSLQSSIDVVYINGVANNVASNPSGTISLGAGAYVAVNQKTVTPTSATVDAIHVYIPNVANIVVDEAVVSADSTDPCAGTTGVPPVLGICPPGSTLETVQQECVIIEPNGTVIVVSRPFKGPSGGTVYALSVARKKTHSPCLSGPGPKYALIAYKKGGRVVGTLFSDRIILIGSYERGAGLGGNDCIDGKGKGETIYDGNGKERIYSNTGNNRIGIGNGNSRIVGGPGNDTITAGNGKDTVYGNGGRNTISIGIGSNHVYATKGSYNKVFSPGTKAHIYCGTIGSKDRVFLRLKALKFAEAHGCTRYVHLI